MTRYTRSDVSASILHPTHSRDSMRGALPRIGRRGDPGRTPRLVLSLALMLIVLLSGAWTGCETTPEENLQSVRDLQEEGRLDESIALLREMIDDGDRSGEVMFRYGRALSLIGLAGRGMWAFETAREDPEWIVRASHQQAVDAYRSGNQELALEILEHLAANRTDDHQDDVAARLLELRVRIETRRQYEESLLLADEILDDFPDQEEATRLKAAALLGLKDTDAAFELIKKAGSLSGGDSSLEDGMPVEPATILRDGTDGTDNTNNADADVDADGLALTPGPQEAYWCLIHSTFKREAGELVEAGEVLTDCLERFPSDIGLISEALKLYGAAKDFTRINEIMKTAYEADPDNKEIRIAWVKHLDNSGREDEAETVLRESLDRALEAPAPPVGYNVNAAAKWVDLGAFLVDHGETKDGLAAYASALEILGDSASPSLLFRYAEGLILAERFDEALEIADRTPIEVHPPMIRGRVAFERGEYEKAADELRSASLKWPDNAPIRYYLARAHEGIGDFDSAIEEYRQAIRSDPTLSAPRERLAKLHIAEGRIRQANTILGFLSPLKESTPSGAMHMLNIEVKARLGQEPNLTVPRTQDLPFDELRRGAVAALARGLRASGDLESTEEILAKLQEQLADAPSRGYFLRSRVGLLIDGGETERAIEIAREASRAPYASADVGIAHGHALVAANQSIDEARDLLTRALVLHPTDLEALTALGDVARLGRDETTATHYYEQALANDPAYRPAFDARMKQVRDTQQGSIATDLLAAYVHRHNPYDGMAALEFAQGLDAAEKERRIQLAKRAIRFGAGETALDWLRTIDPNEAAKYTPPKAPSAG